jgi:ketosteroid isomerase-like protein
VTAGLAILAAVTSREENVEVIRRSFDAFESKDMDAWVADWSDDIVFDVSGYEPWAGESKHFGGHMEILEFFGAMMAGVRVLEVDVHEVAAVDDHRVIAVYTETRQESDAPAPHDIQVGIVYRMRDGKLAHVQVFSDHTAARRAAGLE